MSVTRLIDKEQLTAYERWELPSVDSGRKKRSKEPEPPRAEEVEETAVAPITAEQIEAIQEQAYQEGFEQGFEQGRKEGLASGKAEANAQVQRLQQIVGALAEPLAAVDRQVEQELVALALAVARQLIRRELHTGPDEIVRVVREALTTLPSSATNVKVQLHPEDAQLVREMLAPGGDEERPWRIVDDPVLSRGGCRVVSDRSRIDATLETRLNGVIAQLFGGERGGDAQAG